EEALAGGVIEEAVQPRLAQAVLRVEAGVGRGLEALREQHELLGADRELALLGAQGATVDGDPVPGVEERRSVEEGACGGALDAHLEPRALGVAQVDE